MLISRRGSVTCATPAHILHLLCELVHLQRSDILFRGDHEFDRIRLVIGQQFVDVGIRESWIVGDGQGLPEQGGLSAQHCEVSHHGGLLTYILNLVSGLSDPY